MSKCSSLGDSKISILDTFLVPNPSDDCLIIFTDCQMTAGVISNCHTPISLTRGALQILCQSFIEGPNTLGDILEGEEPGIISNASIWANQLVGDNFFRVSVNKPEIRRCESRPIKAGENLPVNCPNDVTVASDGTVTVIKVNNTKIVWFRSNNDYEVNPIEDVVSAATYGTLGATLYPTTSSGLGSGPNCNACGICGGCVACVACIDCGEINFAAGAAIVTASTTAAAVSGNTAAIEALRNSSTR